MTLNNHIIPPEKMLDGMKSGPYKTTAHAVAELIDNSADARAKEIGVVLIVNSSRLQPHTIAVLDNGDGMSPEVLRHCLQWGFHGKRTDEKGTSRNRRRLGKFGVGLVAASFSQCSDVQVMSWQASEASNGVGVPSTGLSLVEGSEILLKNVLPDPKPRNLPGWATKAFEGMPTPLSAMPHGTLVIWRHVETRNRAATLKKQLVDLSGRIHREFIQHNALKIVVNVYNEDTASVQTLEATPVDPTFLSNWPTDDLGNWGFKGDTTLFQPYTGHIGDTGKDATGAHAGKIINVPHGAPDEQAQGMYVLTSSYRSERAANDPDLNKLFNEPGDAPYGKLANKLKGVSFLRAGREIDLDARWLRPDKTVDRWVSVSVDFDSSLDSIFGITNDKQQVRDLADLAPRSLEEINEEIVELRADGTEDDSDYLERLLVAWHIKDQLQKMQREVRLQRKHTRRQPGGPITTDPTVAPTPELVDTGGRMLKGGRPLPMDTQSPSDDPKATADAYEESMSGDQKAKDVRPAEVETYGLKLDYARSPYASPAEMFHINVGSHMVVHFHDQHPLSDAMVRLLSPREEDDAPTVQDALRVLRGLVTSYARVMAEADKHDLKESQDLKRCLLTWSAKASEIFKDAKD